MHKETYHPFGETLYRDTLENGLEVLLLPKEGFHQTFAMFSTRFGSIDQRFHIAGRNTAGTLPSAPGTVTPGMESHAGRTAHGADNNAITRGDFAAKTLDHNSADDRIVDVPDGVAHFLEHKMFESPTIDVFQEFSRHGASANAFTTFDQTSYLFSATNDIPENLEILLNYVQEPYFTDENVEKEKGIIGQEIRMYQDNPDARSFLEFRKALYQKHPVRLDIAGSIESIAGIDTDILYDCYRTFYHPANMIFVVAGGFNPAEVMDLVHRNQTQKQFPAPPKIERLRPEEPAAVAHKRLVTELAVSQPRCYIGWKDARVGLTGEEILRQELLTGLVLDTLFGKGSDLYHELLEESLIDQQFGWEYECTPGYGYSLIGGNTPNPDALTEKINETLAQVRTQGIPQQDFERNRKKTMGWFAMALDSPTAIARNFTSYYLKGSDWLTSYEVLRQLTWEEANRRMVSHLEETQQAVSIVVPRKSV